MSREHATHARIERNAALMDAMILGATADGHVSKLEKEALLRRVGERPEFEGTRVQDLKDLIEGSVFRLSKTARSLAITESMSMSMRPHQYQLFRERQVSFMPAPCIRK